MIKHRIPRHVEVFGEKRGIPQEMQGIGDEDGEFRLQWKIRFPQVEAHHDPLHAVMLSVIAGALVPCPEKTVPPGRNIINLRLVDADGEGGKPGGKVAARDREQDSLHCTGRIALVAEKQRRAVFRQFVRLSGIADVDSPLRLLLLPVLKLSSVRHLRQMRPHNRLISLLKVNIAFPDKNSIGLTGLVNYSVSGIVGGKGIPGIPAGKSHGTDFAAKRPALPDIGIKEEHPGLAWVKGQGLNVQQPSALVQADLHSGPGIAVIGEAGGTDDGSSFQPFIRAFRSLASVLLRPGVYIREKIVGHIIHRGAGHIQPGIKISAEPLRLLSAAAVREYNHLRALGFAGLGLGSPEGLHYAFRPLQISRPVAAYNFLQHTVEGVLVPDARRRKLRSHGICRDDGKNGLLRGGDQILGLFQSLLHARPAVSAVVLHASAGVEHEDHISPASALPVQIRVHQ